MGTRITGAFAALLLGALLAACGPSDAEINEAQAVAEVKANPTPTPWEPRPCIGGEILHQEPTGTMQTIKPDCFDQAVAEAIDEFPEPLPAGAEWQIRTPDYTDPRENEAGQMPVIEDGVQDSLVAGYWLCAWMDSYLEALDGNDAPGQAEGMEYLSKYTQLPAVQTSLVNPEDFEASVIAPAKDGDPAKLREYFGTCPSYRL